MRSEGKWKSDLPVGGAKSFARRLGDSTWDDVRRRCEVREKREARARDPTCQRVYSVKASRRVPSTTGSSNLLNYISASESRRRWTWLTRIPRSAAGTRKINRLTAVNFIGIDPDGLSEPFPRTYGTASRKIAPPATLVLSERSRWEDGGAVGPWGRGAGWCYGLGHGRDSIIWFMHEIA